MARAGHTDAVRALAVANERLFSGSYDGTVKVWDVDTLACLRTLAGHTGPVRTLVYSGGHMFSGSYDKTVRRPPRPRRCRTAPPRACLCGGSRHDPAGRVWLHAVRREACRGARARRIGGRLRARASAARAQVRVWNVESLACLATLQGHSGAVRALAASPDRVFSGSDDTTIKARAPARRGGRTPPPRCTPASKRGQPSGPGCRPVPGGGAAGAPGGQGAARAGEAAGPRGRRAEPRGCARGGRCGTATRCSACARWRATRTTCACWPWATASSTAAPGTRASGARRAHARLVEGHGQRRPRATPPALPRPVGAEHAPWRRPRGA